MMVEVASTDLWVYAREMAHFCHSFTPGKLKLEMCFSVVIYSMVFVVLV